MKILARRLGGRWAPVVGALLVALVYRAWYAQHLLAAPEFLEPVLDGAAHLEWARGWLSGNWPLAEPFFRAPGYVYALGAGLRVFGDDSSRVALLQLFAGAAVPGMVAWLAGSLGSRTAAWVAGVGAAVYPAFVFFDAQLLAPTLAVPLSLAAAIFSVAALQSDRRGPALAAAVLWSLVAIVRPPLLLPALVLVGTVAWRDRGRAVLVLTVLMLAPAAVTLRNASVGDPVFIASQGGLNFHLGNGPDADGVSATFAPAPAAVGYRMMDAATQIAEQDGGQELRASEVSRYWWGRTWTTIAEDPGRWVSLLMKKGVLLVSAREIPNNHDPALFAQYLPPLRLPGWGWWFPWAIVGMWSARRSASIRFLALAAVIFSMGTVLFFVNARFRMPMVPWMLVLAGVGVSSVVNQLRGREWRAVVLSGVIGVGAAALAHTNPYGIPREPWPTSFVLVAEAERNRNEPVRSLRWIERALEQNPGLYAARVAQVDLLRRMSRLSEAEDALAEVLALQPSDPGFLHQKAILQDLNGRPADGLATLDQVSELEPGYPGLEIDRAVMLARLGQTAAAVEMLRGVTAGLDRANAERAARVLGEIEAGRVLVVDPGNAGAAAPIED